MSPPGSVVLAGVVEHAAGQRHAALGHPQDQRADLLHLSGRQRGTGEGLGADQDALQQVVEVVRHAGGEMAEGRHFLGLALARFQLGAGLRFRLALLGGGGAADQRLPLGGQAFLHLRGQQHQPRHGGESPDGKRRDLVQPGLADHAGVEAVDDQQRGIAGAAHRQQAKPVQQRPAAHHLWRRACRGGAGRGQDGVVRLQMLAAAATCSG